MTPNGARLTLLVAIATLGVALGTPAVMALGSRNGMPDWHRQAALVALLELTVAAGTLTYFSMTRPTYERVIGGTLVLGAMAVTMYAGVTSYGYLGFIAPLAYIVAAHLTAAPRREPNRQNSAEPVPPPWIGGAAQASPRETNKATVIEPDMAAIDPPRGPQGVTAVPPDPIELKDETVERLRCLRKRHGKRSAHKEREALKIGFPKYREARDKLEKETRK